MKNAPLENPIQQIKQQEKSESIAYNQIFNEVLGWHPASYFDWARPAFRTADSFAESAQDQSLAAESLFKHEAATGHARALEKEADIHQRRTHRSSRASVAARPALLSSNVGAR